MKERGSLKCTGMVTLVKSLPKKCFKKLSCRIVKEIRRERRGGERREERGREERGEGREERGEGRGERGERRGERGERREERGERREGREERIIIDLELLLNKIQIQDLLNGNFTISCTHIHIFPPYNPPNIVTSALPFWII